MNSWFFQTDLSPQQIGVVVELAVMVLVPSVGFQWGKHLPTKKGVCANRNNRTTILL